MKIQQFIRLVLLLGAGSSWALPVVSLNQVLNDDQSLHCKRNSQEAEFRNLVHKASVIEGDDRQVLSKNLEVVGFSRTEVEQAMRCTGSIFCPGANNGKGANLSAGSICARGKRTSQGRCSADRIATVGHLFVSEETGQFIPGIELCEFRNYRGHRSKINIRDVKEVLNPGIPASNPHQNMRADKLVIRLEKPIPNCDPYDLPDSSEPPASGSKIVALTHLQEDQAGQFDGSEPMGYPCDVTRTFKPRGGGPSLFYSNCDSTGGASGGFVMTRNSNNRLAVSGMFIRQGRLENGRAYSEENLNYTIVVGTNADFVQMAENPGQRPESRLTREETSPLRPSSGN